MLLYIYVLTHLILLNFLESFLGHSDISLMCLRRLFEIEALLARFFTLDHLVLHHCLHNVVSLVVVVDNAMYVASVGFATGSCRVGMLLRSHPMGPSLQLGLHLAQVQAGGSHCAATPA